jgi:sensor domain CHASE-containing protein
MIPVPHNHNGKFRAARQSYERSEISTMGYITTQNFLPITVLAAVVVVVVVVVTNSVISVI